MGKEKKLKAEKKQKEDKKKADKKPKAKEEKLKAEKKPKKATKGKESTKEKKEVTKAKKASSETLDSVLQPTENELTAILGKFRGIGKDVCPQNEAEEAVKILDMYKASVNKGQVAAREYRKRMLA